MNDRLVSAFRLSNRQIRNQARAARAAGDSKGADALLLLARMRKKHGRRALVAIVSAYAARQARLKAGHSRFPD